ncbi:MAG: GyrI-like domain-containing protein [Bacteroidota bacterium]
MKVLKFLGIGILVLFAVYVIWAAIAPSKIDGKATIEIDRNPAFVYEVSKDFNFYKQWNPWSKMEPEAKSEITGTGRELGDTWKWEGQQIGTGGMTHKEFVQDKKIVNEVTFVSPRPGSMSDVWTFEDKDGKTLVTWITTGEDEIPFLMRPMSSIFMSGVFEQGLNDFKDLVEGMADLPKVKRTNTAYTPVVGEVADITYLAVKDSCLAKDIAQHLEKAYGKLEAYMKANRIEQAGSPMAIYWSYDPDGSTTFEAGIPVKAGTQGKGQIYVAKTDGGKTITCTHLGDYSKSGEAHMVIDEFAKENNMKINEAIEIYENDPTKVKPEEVRTKILYPVKG